MIDIWTTFILENKMLASNIEQLSSDSLKHKDAYFLVLKIGKLYSFCLYSQFKSFGFLEPFG